MRDHFRQIDCDFDTILENTEAGALPPYLIASDPPESTVFEQWAMLAAILDNYIKTAYLSDNGFS